MLNNFKLFGVLTIFKPSKMLFNLPNIKTCNTYEDSVKTLNGLISNASTIAKSVEKGAEIRLQHVPRTMMFCQKAGVDLEDVSKLNIVHVAGTKGKGSTSTYIDAILHSYGYKTGLFTSPHLTEVRERIKINGHPISKSDFGHHFWHIYDRLNQCKTSIDDMPFYFQFLTIMAFHVFLEEKVDFVILETGIGGRFDSTNIIPSSKISCITSLGFDHMEILGYTMKEIAWNKAGIIKPDSVVVTCDSQPQEGLESIVSETQLHNNKLFIVPVKDEKVLSFIKDGRNIHPENVLLASAVCHLLLNNESSINNHINTLDHHNTSGMKTDISNISEFPLKYCTQADYRKVIYSTPVRGRYQSIRKGKIDYFIDGAHTVESMATCVNWFKEASGNTRCSYRFLVFMITGRRSVEDLLSQLTYLRFDGILLSPLVPFIDNQPADFAPDDAIIARENAKLSEIAASWNNLNNLHPESGDSAEYFTCFQEIDDWLTKMDDHVQVLVVGSLHLVGCALAVLEDGVDK